MIVAVRLVAELGWSKPGVKRIPSRSAVTLRDHVGKEGGIEQRPEWEKLLLCGQCCQERVQDVVEVDILDGLVGASLDEQLGCLNTTEMCGKK
jgi:hypothetical protein